MTDRLEFTTEEKEETLALYQKIREEIASSLHEGDEEHMRRNMLQALETKQLQRNVFGLNPILLSFQTAQLVVEEIGLRRDAVEDRHIARLDLFGDQLAHIRVIVEDRPGVRKEKVGLP